MDGGLATCCGKTCSNVQSNRRSLNYFHPECSSSPLSRPLHPSSSAGLVVGPRRRAGWGRGSAQRRGLRWRWQRSTWGWGRRKGAGVGTLGVGREGGGGREVEGWKRRQPGSRGRGQLEEVAVVRGATLVAVGQRVDGGGGGPVGRVAADRVGPAAGEVDALSLKCRKCKGAFHSKLSHGSKTTFPFRTLRRRLHLCFHVNCRKCRFYLAKPLICSSAVD